MRIVRTKRWLSILAFAVPIALLILTSQRGGLTYFSPDSLECHAQSERTIFATGIPFYRSNYTRYDDNPLIAYLVREKFVSPQPEVPGRWQLISHWNESWRGGYADMYRILVRYRKESIEWSENNRACAEIYWSEAFHYLRSNNRKDVNLGHAILSQCRVIDDLDEMRAAIQQLKSAMQ